MVVRSAFGWSIQFSNELGGYALVAITFLSLASGQLRQAYHSVHFLENRLGPRGPARLRLLFDLLAAAVTLVLLEELARFDWLSWQSGDGASNTLIPPRWIHSWPSSVGVFPVAVHLIRRP